jgi:hypothetical protein
LRKFKIATIDNKIIELLDANGSYALKNETSQEISAIGNFWGTTVEATIQAQTYDKQDDKSYQSIFT